MDPLKLTFCSNYYQTSLKWNVSYSLNLYFSFEGLKYLALQYKLFMETFIGQHLFCTIYFMILAAYLKAYLSFNQPIPIILIAIIIFMIKRVFLYYADYRFKKVQHYHILLVYARKLTNSISYKINLVKMYFLLYFIKSAFLSCPI